MSPLSSALHPVERTSLFVALLSGVCWAFHGYHLVGEPMSWHDAQMYCRENYTDLATVCDMDDMKRLVGAVGGGQGQYWTGLTDEPAKWTWSLQQEGFYGEGEAGFTKWNQNEPNNNRAKRLCAATSRGVWTDHSCSHSLYFMCYTADQGGSFVFVERAMTWDAARQHCRAQYTDLASVRNEDENKKIQVMIPNNWMVWIGLSRDFWRWSNQEDPEFKYWSTGVIPYSGGKCVASRIDPQYNGKWVVKNCGDKLSFLCHNKRKMLRIKMTVTTSTGDMNNPAVAEAILKLLEEKLREEGMSEGVKIGWTKGPDGKIFHNKT